MEYKYVLFYTLYGIKYNGFTSFHKFFENKEKLENFIKFKKLVPRDYIIYVKE